MRCRVRSAFVTVVALAVALLATSGAQAIVVDMNALGHSTVPFSSSDQSGYYGVALAPRTCHDLWAGDTCSALETAGVPRVVSAAPCTDPALTPDLTLSSWGLCSHGGSVMAANETFALTWDPHRLYWSGTKGYVEQFLRDVADASGSLGTPYAVTTQYTNGGTRAGNSSKYGGGCIDYGAGGGTACEFVNTMGPGHDYPANGCTPAGDSFIAPGTVAANPFCLTDAQLRGELSTMVAQAGIVGRTQPRSSPIVTLLLPPGVETCLDETEKLCSINGSLTPPPSTVTANTTGGGLSPGAYEVETSYVTSTGEQAPSGAQTVTLTGTTSSITIDSPPPAPGVTGWYAYVMAPGQQAFSRVQRVAVPIGTSLTVGSSPATSIEPRQVVTFCSYHAQVNVGGTNVAYVVVPWTAGTTCDEPDAPPIPPQVTPPELSTAVGLRLVSPLSQAQIATIVNPGLNGFFALDGGEINDNQGCVPLGNSLDSVTVGNSPQNPYLLQREFNNGAAIVFDPSTYFGCAPVVNLSPAFVVPSSVDQGDEVQFDGSATASTLVVPDGNYHWDFGDGTTGTGPSVVHTYANTGTYTVKLTVTDRGGNVESLSQTIAVLGPNGEQPPPPTVSGAGSGAGSTASGGPSTSSGSSSGAGPSPGGGSSAPSHPTLKVHLQLMPQGLKTMLVHGLALRVTSSQAADGFATLSIPRAAARRVHIKAGRGPSVVIGRGTVAGITDGTTSLRLHLSRAIVTKLEHLRHVVVTIRLALVATGDRHVAIDVAGHY
jgi:hypothetical protein